ncbi:hypothetical protein LWI28_009050 [Acer negundo]|uniref:Uncharacterized protein n=1 Tax=Acer negundo TaxID=4023 RepID=A0AAD5IYA8_ACENE|nr:hypothetical protein LWI28_009050 [Acer negundo]
MEEIWDMRSPPSEIHEMLSKRHVALLLHVIELSSCDGDGDSEYDVGVPGGGSFLLQEKAIAYHSLEDSNYGGGSRLLECRRWISPPLGTLTSDDANIVTVSDI